MPSVGVPGTQARLVPRSNSQLDAPIPARCDLGHLLQTSRMGQAVPFYKQHSVPLLSFKPVWIFSATGRRYAAPLRFG